jgi:hypothetical protein
LQGEGWGGVRTLYEAIFTTLIHLILHDVEYDPQ